jgi:hypothetical protein
MITKSALGLITAMFVLTSTVNAQDTNRIQNYFNDTAVKVKATEDPVQKRELLDNSLKSMSDALDRVEHSRLVSANDLVGIDLFRTTLQDTKDELAGNNGFERVPDAQLNAFADYVVQNMEQAKETVTISLVAALLILIILILII